MTERGLPSSPRAPPRAHSAAGDPVGAVAATEYAAMNSPELHHQTQRWFGLAPLLIIALACSSSEGPSVPPGGKALYVVNSGANSVRSEEHTSELQSRPHLVCRLLLEKKKITPQ